MAWPSAFKREPIDPQLPVKLPPASLRFIGDIGSKGNEFKEDRGDVNDHCRCISLVLGTLLRLCALP